MSIIFANAIENRNLRSNPRGDLLVPWPRAASGEIAASGEQEGEGAFSAEREPLGSLAQSGERKKMTPTRLELVFPA